MTSDYFGSLVEDRVETGDIAIPKTGKQLQEEAENHPGVIKVMESFNAQIVSVNPRNIN